MSTFHNLHFVQGNNEYDYYPQVDDTLSVEGRAADAKKTGYEITGLKDDVSKAVVSIEEWEPVTLTLQNGYYTSTGIFYEAYDKSSAKIAVTEGTRYRLSTYIRSTLISGIMFFDANDAVLSTLLDGTGTGATITDYEYSVPIGAVSMAVQSGDRSVAVPVLSAYKKTSSFIGYTKTEIDEKLDEKLDETEIDEKIDEKLDEKLDAVPKKYGIKWEIANPDDLGQRCFDSIGLTATIGVGSTNGQSDFDSIYPWSEIRRCNIRVNANGAKIVTYEGETGFSLDGTNGDVFVRIPKFYYERYRLNGYEYRIISSRGIVPHPAFIENGKEIDEIFIGAFEGYISNNILQSKAAIIPTSNETAQTFLTSAQNKGIGYALYDMRCVDAIWTLMAVEFGCRNTNQIIGYGFADFLQPTTGTYGVDCDTVGTTNTFSASKSIPAERIAFMPVGSNCTICKGSQSNAIASRKITEITSDANHWYISFDGDPIELDTTCFIGSAGCTTNFCETVPSGALTWHTGRANWISGSNIKNPVRYRWMENLVGSLWAFLPDITFNNLQMYFCKDITKYEIGSITNGYDPVGDLFTEQTSNGNKANVANSNYWITDLSELSFGKGVDFGKAWDTSLVSTKAFGAFYYLGNGLRIIANGGGFDHLYRCNMLTNRAWIYMTDKWYLYGARLIYKEIN